MEIKDIKKTFPELEHFREAHNKTRNKSIIGKITDLGNKSNSVARAILIINSPNKYLGHCGAEWIG